MTSVLASVQAEIDKLTPDQIREQLRKLAEKKAKDKERRQGSEAKPLTDEQKEKRKAYNKARSENPEVKAKQKEYRTSEKAVAARKKYQAERNAKIKALLAKAKAEGIEFPAGLTPPKDEATA